MSNETTIMPGAEAYSAQGDRRGALIIHGFTGCPAIHAASCRGVCGRRFLCGIAPAAWPRNYFRGYGQVSMARLDRRGRRRLLQSRFAHGQNYRRWPLYMGGTLTLWTAEQHPEVAAIVVINGACEDEDLKGLVEAAVQAQRAARPFCKGWLATSPIQTRRNSVTIAFPPPRSGHSWKVWRK